MSLASSRLYCSGAVNVFLKKRRTSLITDVDRLCVATKRENGERGTWLLCASSLPTKNTKLKGLQIVWIGVLYSGRKTLNKKDLVHRLKHRNNDSKRPPGR